MNLDQARSLWNQQPAPPIAPQQLWDVAQQHNTFRWRVLLRDLGEWMATLFLVAMWLRRLSHHPEQLGPTALCILLTLFPMSYVSWRRHRLKQRLNELQGGVPGDLQVSLTSSLWEVEEQVALVTSVGLWYLAPLFAVFLMLTFLTPSPWLSPGVTVALGVGVFILIYRHNRRILVRDILPRRARLNALLGDLQAS